MAEWVKRPFAPDDVPQVCRMMLQASHSPGRCWRYGRVDGTEGLVWEEDGELVGALLHIQESIWLGGQPAKSLFRRETGFRRGRVDQWLQAQLRSFPEVADDTQAAIWTMWGRSHHADLGFVVIHLGWECAIEPARSPRPRPTGVRQATPADMPAIAAAQARRAATLAGPRRRQAADWQERIWPYLNQTEGIQALVHEGPGGIDGYVIAMAGMGRHGPELEVLEWGETSGIAWRQLFHALLAMAGSQAWVIIPPMPTDRPLAQLLDGLTVKMRPIRSLEWRAGSMIPFLAGMRYRPGSGSLRLGVRDPLGGWPARLELGWQDGAFAGAAATTETPDVQVDIGNLTLLALGQLTVAQADYMGWLEGPAAAKEQLARVWERQTPFRYWADLGLYVDINRRPPS